MAASKDCNRRNPLQRSGTNQANRMIPALAPGHFRLDERDTADLILFAERLSRQLRFYDSANTVGGDWLPFFSTDITAILAGLSELPVASFQNFGRALQDYLAADPARDPADLRAHFRLVFYLPLLLLVDAGVHFDRLPRDHPLRAFMLSLLARDAAISLADLAGYYKGAIDVSPQVLDDTGLNPADYNTTFAPLDPRIQLPSVITNRIPAAILFSGLSLSPAMIAGFAPDGWTDFYNDPGLSANTSPYEDAIGSPHEVYQQIYDALHYNLLDKALERLFQVAQRISQAAASFLQASLTGFAGHPPHYGLWLAFLRLLEGNREHLNTLTGRHLDYYYRKVLQLCRRQPQPDHVFLLVELNKNIQEHLLPAATTLFRGGKDATGKEVLYQLDADFVANRGQVAALKALRLETAGSTTKPQLHPHAAAVANSRNGQGQALPKEDPQWPPFGPLEVRPQEEGALAEKLSPNARVGFAVADWQLFLREGKRTITLQVAPSAPFGAQANLSGLKLSLTGEKGWVHFSAASKLSVKKKTTDGLVIKLTLDGSDPAILPYDQAVHGESLPTAAPVLQVTFDFPGQAAAAGEALHGLRNLSFTSIKLSVEVAEARNFSLQNEAGVIDVSKPFLPFGPAPTPNSAIILGSSEVFSKPIQRLDLSVEWEKEYYSTGYFLKKDGSSYHLTPQSLAGGVWEGLAGQGAITLFDTVTFNYQYVQQGVAAGIAADAAGQGEVMAFYAAPAQAAQAAPAQTAASQSISQVAQAEMASIFIDSGRFKTITLNTIAPAAPAVGQTIDTDVLENPPYTSQSRSGFIRLALNQDFGHSKYVDEKTRALIILATEGTWAANASYNYYTGNLPKEPYTPKVVAMTLSYQTAAAAPAQFFHLHPFGVTVGNAQGDRLLPELSNQGELYIGVKDLAPPQRLSLLFQVVDGTANPLKPPPKLQWHYLFGNAWQAFDEQDVADGAENLTRSGIVGLAVPEAADTAHTLMPAGLHWFRVSAAQDIDAVNNLLSIDSQAISATFLDQGNDPAFLATPLPAGAIAKLKTGDPAVKKIIQPAASFGGAPMEASDRFYVRASERLRHKDRGVTMWDYERLVLERFPNVYKVKCINHTELQRDVTQTIVADNELRPGHVVVVTIPNLLNNPNADPLRPYTDSRTLVAVAQFLQERLSPFVRLEVTNPKFEEVQVKFRVAFSEDIADTAFYLKEIESAIVRFLCPWAYIDAASRAQTQDISFGGKWHKSAIINFVEELPYVDYLRDFEMYHKVDIEQSDAAWNRIDEEVAQASTARSILVAHKEHIITEIV